MHIFICIIAKEGYALTTTSFAYLNLLFLHRLLVLKRTSTSLMEMRFILATDISWQLQLQAMHQAA
jgi:hypothetical protein